MIICKEIEKAGTRDVDIREVYEKAMKEKQLERITNLDDVKLFILYAVATAEDNTVRNIYEKEYRDVCRGASARMLGYTRFNFYLKSLQDQSMLIITKSKKEKTLYNRAQSKVNKSALEEEYENRKILSTKYNI